eukprot:729541-Hanusia_phi.AAC.1
MAMQHPAANQTGDLAGREERTMVGRVAQGTETGKVRPIRIFVNWNGELEMVFSEPTKLVSDLAKEIRSAPQVPYHHKFLVYKGLLLLPFLTLDQAVQNDGGRRNPLILSHSGSNRLPATPCSERGPVLREAPARQVPDGSPGLCCCLG